MLTPVNATALSFMKFAVKCTAKSSPIYWPSLRLIGTMVDDHSANSLMTFFFWAFLAFSAFVLLGSNILLNIIDYLDESNAEIETSNELQSSAFIDAKTVWKLWDVRCQAMLKSCRSLWLPRMFLLDSYNSCRMWNSTRERRFTGSVRRTAY